MGLDVYASLHKDDGRLKKIHAAASLLFSVHYGFLGAGAGALTEVLNALRTALSAYTRSKIPGFFFLGLYGVCLFVIPDSFVATLPFLAALFITTGLYFFDGLTLRLFYLSAWALWLFYAVTVFSVGGIVLFVILLITTGMTSIRLYREKRQT